MQPYLVRYAHLPDGPETLLDRWDMWRYAAWMPLVPDESPVTLGEGATPLFRSETTARHLGVRAVWIKEEGLNPTGRSRRVG